MTLPWEAESAIIRRPVVVAMAPFFVLVFFGIVAWHVLQVACVAIADAIGDIWDATRDEGLEAMSSIAICVGVLWQSPGSRAEWIRKIREEERA